MKIRLSKEVVNAIGAFDLKLFGVVLAQLEWQGYVEVNLGLYNRAKLATLKDLLASVVEGKPKGILTALRDLDEWTEALGGGEPRARTVENFKRVLHLALFNSPGHRVYFKDDVRGVTFASYVNEVEYHPPQHISGGGMTTPKASIELLYLEFGVRGEETIYFYGEDCLRLTVREALARKGYYLETEARRLGYLTEVDTFLRMTPQVGKQYRARGTGTDDVDGNTEDKHRWWRSRTNTIDFERGGGLGAVVIDVFKEDAEEESGRERRTYVNEYFWERKPYIPEEQHGEVAKGKGGKKKSRVVEDEDDDGDGSVRLDEVPDDALLDKPEIEIPIHPNLVVFDLRRHTRLRVHVAQLTEYSYDTKLGEKLILPAESRDLIDVLLQHNIAFADIIAGKSSGSVVLSAGPPGTGKTLTAEVYAEVTKRPLYTVQCSQLGTAPDDLEDELLKVFARAQRWNAILLLDEADVYVSARGANLIQNAIVGVFLRTLEYYKGLMFLTTNRADLVDDAIASRCVARIEYARPSAGDLARIWTVLSETAGAKLSPKDIAKLLDAFPHLSGRDVKNLLKLGMMVSAAKGKAVDVKTIEFVKRFKPTIDAPEVA